MNEPITVLFALVAGIALAGLLFVIRSPKELWSLIRNPREHLFGRHEYVSDDETGMLWEGPWHVLPEGFTRYTDINPFTENTYVVIFNSHGETLWGLTSDEIWPRRNYLKPWRDDVVGYRAMTEEEIVEQEAFVAEMQAREETAR